VSNSVLFSFIERKASKSFLVAVSGTSHESIAFRTPGGWDLAHLICVQSLIEGIPISVSHYTT
jgi:hypothetical protein